MTPGAVTTPPRITPPPACVESLSHLYRATEAYSTPTDAAAAQVCTKLQDHGGRPADFTNIHNQIRLHRPIRLGPGPRRGPRLRRARPGARDRGQRPERDDRHAPAPDGALHGRMRPPHELRLRHPHVDGHLPRHAAAGRQLGLGPVRGRHAVHLGPAVDVLRGGAGVVVRDAGAHVGFRGFPRDHDSDYYKYHTPRPWPVPSGAATGVASTVLLIVISIAFFISVAGFWRKGRRMHERRAQIRRETYAETRRQEAEARRRETYYGQ
ncbi:hypothetical protein PG994_013532 [Apiospora phragmitis]|uniref:Uncharacterized protein n=1 Tax=Apiospora phragmitis TaxID=2905665 RepID=A0ABR1T8V8_9PEZI